MFLVVLETEPRAFATSLTLFYFFTLRQSLAKLLSCPVWVWTYYLPCLRLLECQDLEAWDTAPTKTQFLGKVTTWLSFTICPIKGFIFFPVYNHFAASCVLAFFFFWSINQNILGHMLVFKSCKVLWLEENPRTWLTDVVERCSVYVCLLPQPNLTQGTGMPWEREAKNSQQPIPSTVQGRVK